MQRKIFHLILVLILFPLFSLSQEKLTPSAQLEDLDYLIAKLEEIHPQPYEYLAKEEFYFKLDAVKKELVQEGTPKALAKLLMPLLSSLGDAHTEMGIPRRTFRAFQEAGGKVFPFPVDIRGETVFISEQGSYHHAEIIRINKIPIYQLLGAIRSYVSAEREAFREVVIERLWSSYLWLELGEIQQIELKREGKIIVLNNWEKVSPATKVKAYEIALHDSYAYLDFRRMENLGAFRKFLKTSFRQIENKGIDTLIIDLRNNGGGDSRLGDALISYLYEGKYRQVESLQVKASRSQKQYFYQNYIPFFLRPFLPIFKLNPVLRASFGKAGKTYDIDLKEKTAKRSKNSFVGKVYVLIGSSTFSSASLLANALKYYDIAELLGNETGGISIFYGDNIYVELPNSGLRSTISFKKFFLPGGKEDREGISPHRFIPELEDDRLGAEELMELIRK